MLEVFRQVVMNLRANKLRSVLTMFGILWGVISVVILSATGEGFRRGNEKVLMELGKNVAIVWGVRTGMQAGGERAGRQVLLTVDDVRAVLARLPRSSEVLVRDRVKFRVGQIVYVAFSQDETEIGFAFPKEERAALVAARPDVFFLPRESELRFHWVEAWLDALDADEMRELVLDAWRMVVPQRVAREVLGPPAAGHKPGRPG